MTDRYDSDLGRLKTEIDILRGRIERRVPGCREHSMALTKLDEVEMWIERAMKWTLAADNIEVDFSWQAEKARRLLENLREDEKAKEAHQPIHGIHTTTGPWPYAEHVTAVGYGENGKEKVYYKGRWYIEGEE